jgi:hypothetical protein
MAMLLDIVEVAALHTGKTLVHTFTKVLNDFGIKNKVR